MFTFLILSIITACAFRSVSASSECKRCPYTLCPNVDPGNSTVLSCWTNGSPIGDNDTIWVKTTQGCYYTEYDLPEHDGDYTEELPYCGYVKPEWTTTEVRTKYISDCYSGPGLSEHDIRVYNYEIDITLTCRAKDRYDIMGKTTWYKTVKNCYVHELTLHNVEDADELDDCGPAFQNLDPHDHDPPVATSTSTATATATPVPTLNLLWTKPDTAGPDLTARSDLQRRFLYNTTAGEEYVNCTANPSLVEPGRNERVYEFGAQIVLQCGTYGDTDNNIFLFTTDFCYVRDNETDPTLTESTVRSMYFPHCDSAMGADE